MKRPLNWNPEEEGIWGGFAHIVESQTPRVKDNFPERIPNSSVKAYIKAGKYPKSVSIEDSDFNSCVNLNFRSSKMLYFGR